MIILVLTVIFICVVVFVHLYLKRFKLPINVAVLPRKLQSVLGHSLYLLEVKDDLYSFLKTLGEHCIENNGISAFFVGPMPVYTVANPEDATIILTKCIEKMFVYQFIEPLFGDTLITAKGHLWKRNRKIIDLAFKQNILYSYMDIFNHQAKVLAKNLEGKAGRGQVDISEDIIKSVLETTCQTTMGMRPDGKQFANDQYVKAFHTVFDVVTKRAQKAWLLVDVVFKCSSLKKELDDALDVIVEVSGNMVSLRKQEHLERLNNKEPCATEGIKSYLQILIENNVSESESLLTDVQLRYLCDNILFASIDTTSYELLFTLICIGSSEAVQEKIFEEIKEVVGDEEVNKHHLPKLVYLEAAIKEAVRLYPIGPVVGRQATTKVELSNTTLPSGSPVIVHLWAINRNKKYWGEDANSYNPDRWFDKATLPKHPNTFASFSFGRRNCIGKIYAMMNMKATLVPILRKFKMSANHEEMDLSCFILVKPKSGHLIELTLR